MARNYHEPDPFRWSLGAFVQAGRNVTFMLQKEKSLFPDFGFYDAWVEMAKMEPILSWLGDTRTDVVHRQALEPHSRLEMRCLVSSVHPLGPHKEPFRFSPSPFACTHYYISLGPLTDHGHEFERFWSMEGIAGRELLEVGADIYEALDRLVTEAHRQLGHGLSALKGGGSKRALSCMEEVSKHRTATTQVQDGREVWLNEPAALHND
jgi:hypothetical protein